jgi:hypothetical protein
LMKKCWLCSSLYHFARIPPEGYEWSDTEPSKKKYKNLCGTRDLVAKLFIVIVNYSSPGGGSGGGGGRPKSRCYDSILSYLSSSRTLAVIFVSSYEFLRKDGSSNVPVTLRRPSYPPITSCKGPQGTVVTVCGLGNCL